MSVTITCSCKFLRLNNEYVFEYMITEFKQKIPVFKKSDFVYFYHINCGAPVLTQTVFDFKNFLVEFPWPSGL